MVAVSANAAENPVLTIEGGQVQGVLADDHPDVYVYRGIPYAAPPIRENRWKAPQPVVPWKGVKICDTFGRPSYQAIQYTGGYYTEWGYGKEAQGGCLQRGLSVSERLDESPRTGGQETPRCPVDSRRRLS